MKKTLFNLSVLSLILLALPVTATAKSQKFSPPAPKFVVQQCRYEYRLLQSVAEKDRYDFCSKKAMQAYQKAIGKPANLNDGYVLVEIETGFYGAVNPKNYSVIPFPYEFVADTDYNGKIYQKFIGKNACFSTNGSIASLMGFGMPADLAYPSHGMCFSFNKKEGFVQQGIYNFKTNKFVGVYGVAE